MMTTRTKFLTNCASLLIAAALFCACDDSNDPASFDAAATVAVLDVSAAGSYLRDTATHIPVMPDWSGEIAAIKTMDAAIPAVPAGTAVTITLADGASTTSDSGKVGISGNVITITAAGVYELTGALTDGKVIVETTGDVALRLAGVNITAGAAANHAAIACYGANLFIIPTGANTLAVTNTDTAKYNGNAKPKGVIYSSQDLIVDGPGSLALSTAYHSWPLCPGQTQNRRRQHHLHRRTEQRAPGRQGCGDKRRRLRPQVGERLHKGRGHRGRRGPLVPNRLHLHRKRGNRH
jgi:hypothetical protein